MTIKADLFAPLAVEAELRTQYGALCWRDGKEGVEVLLITSRDTGRWIIPKGWPMPGLAPEAAAAQEAWEEAGAEGVMNPLCVGRFGYQKCFSDTASVPCAVAVYGMRVEGLAKSFPEMTERRRKWFPVDEAATLVADLERSFINSSRVTVVASAEERDEIRGEREDQQQNSSPERGGGPSAGWWRGTGRMA